MKKAIQKHIEDLNVSIEKIQQNCNHFYDIQAYIQLGRLLMLKQHFVMQLSSPNYHNELRKTIVGEYFFDTRSLELMIESKNKMSAARDFLAEIDKTSGKTD